MPLPFLPPLPDRLLVGVSGGRDSMTLLHALARIRKSLVVVHFDHAWRPESAGEQRQVHNMASLLGCEFLGGRDESSASPSESTAREARWEFFRDCARRSGCHDLVLAHHADDQVETFLLQLLRGTGSRWRGMQSPQTHGDLVVYRPWLGAWGSEIQQLALDWNLHWTDDPSNRNPRYLRNRVRHEILPLLESVAAPGLRQRLWQTAQTQQSQADWMQSLLPQEFPERLSVKTLRTLHPGEQQAWMMAWLRQQQITDLSYDLAQAALALLNKPRPAKINLPNGKFLRRQAGWLFIA